MKKRIKATELWVQLNRKPAFYSVKDDKRVNYTKAYMPAQFEDTIQEANNYTTYTPVAIWKIKHKPIKNKYNA